MHEACLSERQIDSAHGGVEFELPEIEVPAFDRNVFVEAVADERLVRNAGLALACGRARKARR